MHMCRHKSRCEYMYVCLVLWHFNHCWLSNAKSGLFIYILDIYMICKHVNKLKWFQVLLSITNNSIKHQSFVYKQLNVKTMLFLTIQFSNSHLFALSLNFKQFYLTHR